MKFSSSSLWKLHFYLHCHAQDMLHAKGEYESWKGPKRFILALALIIFWPQNRVISELPKFLSSAYVTEYNEIHLLSNFYRMPKNSLCRIKEYSIGVGLQWQPFSSGYSVRICYIGTWTFNFIVLGFLFYLLLFNKHFNDSHIKHKGCNFTSWLCRNNIAQALCPH